MTNTQATNPHANAANASAYAAAVSRLLESSNRQVKARRLA